LAEQKRSEEYQAHLKATQEQIEAEFPELTVAPKDDPEGAEALKRGYDFVDTVLKQLDSMTVKDRAEHNAVFRARVAASYLQEHQAVKLREERDNLLKELTELRGSDPGKGGAKPTPTPPKEGVGGIAAMAAKFDEA
jgi:hypothetical protein